MALEIVHISLLTGEEFNSYGAGEKTVTITTTTKTTFASLQKEEFLDKYCDVLLVS